MRRFLPILLLLCEGAICARALPADDVRLQNGKTFEGVIVAERDGTLDLQMPGGTISIPKSSVREVVPSDSPYTEYLSRAAELRGTGAGAARWLELALWASSKQMETAAREAALVAAALDPSLAELAPRMRALGYELDEANGRWLPFEEVMRSRGLVLVDGNWLSREEAAELRRRNEEEARDREAARLERAAAEMRLAAAEMELNRATYDSYPDYYDDWWGVPYYWPVGFHPGFHPGKDPGRPHPAPHTPRVDRGGSHAPPAGATTRNGVAQQPGGAGRNAAGVRSTPSPPRR
jgi:hypothetical protein